MKKITKTVSKVSIYLCVFALLTGISVQAFAKPLEDENVQKIKTKIRISNLLNTLSLSDSQMQILLDAAHQAQEIRSQYKGTFTQHHDYITETYEDALEASQSGSLVMPEEVSTRVHRVKRAEDQQKAEAQEKSRALIAQVEDILEPHQMYALENYSPCVVPHVDNGRIGQSSDLSGFTQKFDKIRTLSNEEYEMAKDKFADKMVEKSKTKVPIETTVQEEEIKNRILTNLDKIRNMSKVDFEVEKEKIAQEIKDSFHKKTKMSKGKKIRYLLLHPEVIPLLEERLTLKQSESN